MKVYIVKQYVTWEASEIESIWSKIESIWSTQELADLAKEKCNLKLHTNEKYVSFDVEDYEVDPIE